MKRVVLFAVALLLTMGADAQDRKLFLNKESGIYGQASPTIVGTPWMPCATSSPARE